MSDYPGQDPERRPEEPASDPDESAAAQPGSEEPQPGWQQPPGGQPPAAPPSPAGSTGSAPYYPPTGQPYPTVPPYPTQQQPGQQPPPGQSQPPYGQPYQYAGQYGYGQQPYPYATGPTRPNHPQAGLALGLGLGGVIGAFVCGLPLLLSPFAWAIGHRVRREIRESRGQYDGDGMAQAGMILGIVGSVLLVLAVLGLGLVAIALIADNSSSNI